MSLVVWLVGAPGAGKTTLCRALLNKADSSQVARIDSPKWTIVYSSDRPLRSVLVLAGHYTGTTFDGSDRIPYNGARAAIEFWKTNLAHAPVTVLDGDRFSNQSSWDAFADHQRLVIRLTAREETLEVRRKERGSNQNDTWLKGRETKVKNFALRHDAKVIIAEKPVDKLLVEFDALIGDVT